MKSSQLPEIDTLSLKEQIAQTIVVRASGYLFDAVLALEAGADILLMPVDAETAVCNAITSGSIPQTGFAPLGSAFGKRKRRCRGDGEMGRKILPSPPVSSSQSPVLNRSASGF